MIFKHAQTRCTYYFAFVKIRALTFSGCNEPDLGLIRHKEVIRTAQRWVDVALVAYWRYVTFDSAKGHGNYHKCRQHEFRVKLFLRFAAILYRKGDQGSLSEGTEVCSR